MSKIEMQERMINLQDELQGIINNGEAEERELNETENNRMVEIRNEIDSLKEQIAAEEQENREIINNKENKKETRMENKEIRLFDLIKGVAEGNITDEMRQYVNGNKISLRGVIQAQGEAGTGKENVPTDEKSLELAIRNASVLRNLDCTVFSNAVGDIQIPKYSGSNCGWKGELSTADDGAGEFSEVVLRPKRLTAVLKISKTFLAQDRNSAESLLIRDLADAVAERLDETIFGAQSGTTERPEGLFYNSGYTTTGGTISAITYDDILDLECKVEEHNGRNFTFVMAPGCKYALKSVQMASGLQMVWNGGEVDGYKAVVSNSVEKGGILCFDARDLAVAFWNGMGEITVDNFSLAQDNQVKIVINMYVDAALKGDRIAAAIFE